MSRTQPLCACLRPLAAPRASASRPLSRFSTATRLHLEQSTTSAARPAPTSRTAATPATPSTTTPTARSTTPTALRPSRSGQDAASRPDLRARRAKPYKHSQDTKPPREAPASNPSNPFPEATISKSKFMKSRPLKTYIPPLLQTPMTTAVSLPPPKYHISKSHSQNYPVYSEYKRGGNLHLTTVRKITGDLSALRDELSAFLNKKDGEVKINQLTSHVIVKGHHVGEITEFLKVRGL